MSRIDDQPSDTLPAPHPDTPEWAVQFFNTLLKVYQEAVQQGRERDAFILEFTAVSHDHEGRLRELERPPMNGSSSAYTVPDEDTDPGPRN